MKAFTEESADFMLATDLVSRGLDIERVKTVSEAIPGNFMLVWGSSARSL